MAQPTKLKAMTPYIKASIHERINFKGNNELRGMCFGNLPIGYGKKVGALTAMGSVWDIAIYAQYAIMEYTRRKGDRPAKYSQSQFNQTCKK